MSLFLGPIIWGGGAFLMCLAITPLVIKLATKKGWIVAPRHDRWHQKPTALLGGIAIFLSFSLATIFTNNTFVGITVYGVMQLLFWVGLIDDVWEVKPVIKLLAQILGAFVLIYHGLYFGGGLLGWAGIPLTFFWVIGITNAINLLDNMDGLAAGISGIIALITGILAILKGEYQLAVTAFAITGSTVGFLFYNFKPARIFMGDSGSLFLGFSLAYLSIAIQNNLGSSSGIIVLLVPIGLMAIPIMDTTLVTVKRLAAGRRIDQGGKDHTSHRLVALGLSEKKAVLILYGLSAVWGVLCILMFKTQINNLLLCIALLTIGSVVFSIILSQIKVYNESEEKLAYLRYKGHVLNGNNLTLRFLMLHKKLIIGICTDIMIICGAFLIASKGMNVPDEKGYVVLATFIVVKISAFYLSNFYYRIWRFMEIIEIVGYFVIACIATIILALTLFLKGNAHYSFYFFVFDFLLTFTGIVIARFFYRWLSELISRGRTVEKKVLIYGAGAGGCLLIKELLQNQKHELKPVGWFDDDETKHNMFLYGYKIFGGKDQLVNVCKKIKPDIILISTNHIDQSKEESIKQLLSYNQDITIGRFNLSLSYNNERSLI
ncbi:MAG: hypothetical protein JWQ79_3626 [Mucilaginibacter sp.]|jgi:UDP-GlcNAc:undecaprenyl-phosphate GlcNAc-1-phosphate transferase|nr:hypothetical protein [Mucilaginibacter sp.]